MMYQKGFNFASTPVSAIIGTIPHLVCRPSTPAQQRDLTSVCALGPTT
jgi:hypothetical protein